MNLDHIYEAATRTLIPLRLHETHKSIVDEAMKLVDAKYGSIFMHQDGMMRRVYASSSDLQLIKPRKRGKTYEVFKKQVPYLRHTSGIKKTHPEIEQLDIQSDISVPLVYGEYKVGVLSVLSDKSKKFSQDDLETIQKFSSHSALLLRRTAMADSLRANIEKSDVFLSIAAHELKNPLSALSAYAQLLESMKMKNVEQIQVFSKRMQQETRRLSRLVDELLGLGKLRTDGIQVSLQRCNMREIMNRVLADCAFMHPDHKLLYKLTLPTDKGFVAGDRDKLLQVFINLVSNSAKYSPKHSTITLRATYKSPNVILTVSDKGRGIPKSELTNIFKRFYKGKHADQTSMGIGLYLVKHIIDKHHGIISIKSQLGKGTSISIALPEYA